MKLPIFLDNHSTTPMDPRVLEAMLPYFVEKFGNAASRNHAFGWAAEEAVENARKQIAKLIKADAKEIVFTSGATESDNLALKGVLEMYKEKGNHIITSSTEHRAVLDTAKSMEAKGLATVTYLPVDKQGMVNPDDVRNAITDKTILISIMLANNEIGTVQPVAEIGALCRERGVLFHTDAVQWFGKEPFDRIDQFNADLVSVCAHKIYGPKGAGALFIRSPLHPLPLIVGGAQENERRAGTENLASIIGFVRALEKFVAKPVFVSDTITQLAQRLTLFLNGLHGVRFIGSREHCLPNTVSCVVENADAIAVLAALDLEGICASSGSACSAGSIEPSHVLQALGLDQYRASSLLRFSFGRESTSDDLDHLERVFPDILRRVQHIQ